MEFKELADRVKRLTAAWPHNPDIDKAIRSGNEKYLIGFVQRIALNTTGVSRSEANKIIAEYHGKTLIMR